MLVVDVKLFMSPSICSHTLHPLPRTAYRCCGVRWSFLCRHFAVRAGDYPDHWSGSCIWEGDGLWLGSLVGKRGRTRGSFDGLYHRLLPWTVGVVWSQGFPFFSATYRAVVQPLSVHVSLYYSSTIGNFVKRALICWPRHMVQSWLLKQPSMLIKR